ncbi:MAG TPA: hypothetical protein VMX13_07285 [Sedimentisphaerales bacterium]|nr:hypothetical protein [Sedimentisphaerales bacterium]
MKTTQFVGSVAVIALIFGAVVITQHELATTDAECLSTAEMTRFIGGSSSTTTL